MKFCKTITFCTQHRVCHPQTLYRLKWQNWWSEFAAHKASVITDASVKMSVFTRRIKLSCLVPLWRTAGASLVFHSVSSTPRLCSSRLQLSPFCCSSWSRSGWRRSRSYETTWAPSDRRRWQRSALPGPGAPRRTSAQCLWWSADTAEENVGFYLKHKRGLQTFWKCLANYGKSIEI